MGVRAAASVPAVTRPVDGSTSAAGARPKAPRGFGVIWATVALDMVGFGILLPVLPLYAEDFGASPATAAALIAVFSAAQMVAAPFWGRLSDRIGRRTVLVAALVGSCLGSLVTGLAGALWVLFAGRVLDGFSGSSYAVGQAAVADLAKPEDRPRLMGMLAAAFGVGFVAGPLIGSIASLAEVKRLVGVPISLTFSSVKDVPPQECAIETIPRLRVLSALATPVIVDLGELISIKSSSLIFKSSISSGLMYA